MKEKHKLRKLPIFNIIALILPFVAVFAGILYGLTIYDTLGLNRLGAVIIATGIGITISFLCAIISLLRKERWSGLAVIELIIYGICVLQMLNWLFT